MKKDKIMGTKKWFYWVSIGVILILVYKFLDNFTGIGEWLGKFISILSPFIVAIIIAYVLYIPCRKLEEFLVKHTKMKHVRGLSILIVYLIFAALVILSLKFIIPAIMSSIIDLVNNAQEYYNSIKTIEIGGSWAPFIQDNVLKPMVEYLQNMDFQSFLTFDKIQEYIISAVGALKALVDIFIAFICSIYILAERESIKKYIHKFASAAMSEKGYKKFTRYFTNGNEIFFRFISSQVIDACVVAILMSITLSIMNVKYAVLLGVMIGVFNLIPYFGAIIAVIIAGLITILTGGWQQALIMVVIITIVQQLDANIINPKITGTRLNISPLLVIFSVTIGGAYFGIAGMFLGVPIAVLIKLMIDDYIENKNTKKKEIEDKTEINTEIVKEEKQK